MFDQLKDVQVILKGHIQTETALGTASKKDVSNFEYLLALIAQSLNENTFEKQNNLFGKEIGSIDQTFYDSIVSSINNMERIPPRDQKVMFDFIAYCNNFRVFFETKGVPVGPVDINDLAYENDPDKEDLVAADKAGMLNESISKRIIEYYTNEINKLTELIATNLLIVSHLERENQATDKVKKRIEELTKIKQYYEDNIEHLNNNPVIEILYLDQWDKKNPEKVTTFSKKALDRNISINKIQRKLRELKYAELIAQERSERSHRISFFQKAKINATQNIIKRLKKKRGNIIIKQRFIVINKAKEQIKLIVKRREKLAAITKEHYEYTQKLLAEKEKLERAKNAKARQGKIIAQLLSLFKSNPFKQEQEAESLNVKVGRNRRKKGSLSPKLVEQIDRKVGIYDFIAQNKGVDNLLKINESPTPPVADAEIKPDIEVLTPDLPVVDDEQVEMAKSATEEIPEKESALDSEELVDISSLMNNNNQLDKSVSVDSKEGIVMESEDVVDLTKDIMTGVPPRTNEMATEKSIIPSNRFSRLAIAKNAVIKGWQAYSRAIEEKSNNHLIK